MNTRTRHPRNLVVLRAGDGSLHAPWIAAATRDFDLFVSYYGRVSGRWREGAEYYEQRPGPKWPCLGALLQAHPALLDAYDAFWFPDDDLACDGATIDRMFAFFHAHQLGLAQPALTPDSPHTWKSLLQVPGSLLRYTHFVEVMAPIFGRAALRACQATFDESRSGWGLDWVWPRLCREAGAGPLAVIDATPVRHTRPVGGELYRNHPELDPRADARRVVGKYQVEEVRALAQYTIDGCVRATPLPLLTRFTYLLKRLNGRRKHLLGR